MVQIVLVLTALVAFAAATKVSQCPGKSIDNLERDVALMPCTKIPCKLKKGTEEHISIKFTPEKDIQDIRNHVTAEVFGVPVPFIGVDGNTVCDKMFTEGGDKASCPLKAGTTYIYKDSFKVLGVYPSISTKVHWALQDAGNDITCFEVPVRIA